MTAAITLQGLKRRALSLGMVKAFDQGMQFLLPIVLVRCLDAATFGEYRLLWLTVGTLIGIGTLNMAGVLFFFVPRSEPARKRLHIHQTMLYLAAVGLLCGLVVSPLDPFLPERAEDVAWWQRAMAKRPDSTDVLEKVDVPSLVLVGEHDKLTPPDVAAKLAVTLRHAMSERVEDSGHLVPVEQPEEFRARLERWREQVGL